ncbi:MAG: transcriptional repressor LexA [Termitinemataceae bacterium]|nr:MAG: transcriptional repressor LexA [Termitinemataceae bacterium]
MKDLTKKQQNVLQFITKFNIEHNYSPTIREIAKNFEITVKAAFDHVNALRIKGKLTSEKGCLRTLQVVEDENSEAKNSFVYIPIIGEVSAGVGILSEEDRHGVIPVHSSMLKKNQEYFAVKVRGDSMTGIGIVDGDTAVIRKCESAENGSVVVAMINEGYVLKKFYRQSENIKLCSANSQYHPIYTNEIQILGRLAFVFRLY